MEESTSKEKILKSVRNALLNKTANPFENTDFSTDLFYKQDEGPEVEFALKLNDTGGVFVYCENELVFLDHLKSLITQNGWDQLVCTNGQLNDILAGAQINAGPTKDKLGFPVSITPCDYLVARFGSIVVSSKLSARNLFVGADTHLIVAKASQVVKELKDALLGLKTKYSGQFPSQVTLITGPSRTADIEKTLVMGAHGPKNLFVFMIDDAE